MKKFIILLAAVFAFSVASIAQTKVYAEIVGDSDAGVSIKVDFGKNSQKFGYMTKGENGKKMYFGSMVDAMNQLAKYGWKLESTYVVVDGDIDRITSEYHWIISKEEEPVDDEQGESKQQF